MLALLALAVSGLVVAVEPPPRPHEPLTATSTAPADPCAEAPPACRLAARDAILTWRTEARAAEAHHAACLERLSVRTSTVIERLVPVPAPVVAPEEPARWQLPALAGAVGVVVGLLVGVLVAK